MTRKLTTLSGLAMVLIFVSACASGGMGDILGGGGGTNNPSSYGTIRGTVDYVDVNNRSIVLTNVSGLSSMLSNSSGNSGSTVRVYFDNQTSIQYQGQGYRPEDLERGDEVDVRVMESGNQLVAETVTVVRDSSPGTSTGGSQYPQDTYGTTVTGTVRYIDVNRRTIELDRGYGNGTMIVEYDDRTPVTWNNQSYRPGDLERGDEVQVRITNLGNNRYRADTISVVRSVSGGVGSSSGGGIYGNQNSGAIRGTVRYVDTARRTIELEAVSGISGFNTGAGSAIVIQYGSNATIDVRGQQLPLSGLERGDVIEAYVDRSGSSYIGNRFVLVRDVNSY